MTTKNLVLSLLLLMFFSCNKKADDKQVLQNRIDSLETKLTNTYKPGFGEFMSSIQVHHNKLWFAGQNQNWKLANFEINEITESIKDIQKYQTERKESKLIGMIIAALDSVHKAIYQKNSESFKSSYTSLTNTCNSCHLATNFGFNVVKIPDNPPFSNQDFRQTDGK